MIALDTSALVRFLVRDDEAQFQAAKALVDQAESAGEPLLVLLSTLAEVEWVLRTRYGLDKAAIAGAFTGLLESRDVAFEHEPTVEEALYTWAQQPAADFASCVRSARAAQLGRSRFATFRVSCAPNP